MQAAAARLADTHLLGDALVGLELQFGEHACEIDARAELRREDVHFEPERAESCFHAEMPRRKAPIGSALQAPVGLLRRGDESRMARTLELLRGSVGGRVRLAPSQRTRSPDRHV